MPKVEIELTRELWGAIDAERGSLTRGEFIEMGMNWAMKPRIKLDKAKILKG